MFEGFRNVTFNDIHCTCLSLPYLCGRDGGAIENVSFNDCVFEQCKESDFPQNRKQHGAVLVGKPDEPMKNVINLEYNNTRFVVR